MDYEALSQSAERRMLEHRRKELGITTSAGSAWSRNRENPTSLLPAATIDRTGARLDVAVTAWPAEGLIPGAVVTVTIVVSNGGIDAAEGVTITAPAPTGSTYRPGSLKHDGRDADDSADALFGEGLQIRTVIAAGRTALTWKLDVNPGTEDLFFAPSVRADVPVVTARPLVLHRSASVGAFKADLAAADAAGEAAPPATIHVNTTHEDVEAPFYELNEEEEIEETAVLAAVERTPSFEPPEPTAPTLPRPAPAAPLAMLYRTIRPGDLGFVERLMEQSLGLLPHFVLLNLLTAATTGDGADPLGLAAFVDREAGILGRLKVASRLGKPLPLDEGPSSTPALDVDLATVRFADPPASRMSGALLLAMPLDERRLADARAARDRAIAPWLTLRLVSLAFCVQGRTGTDADDASIRQALATYCAQARLTFIAFATRMKLDRRLDPTKMAASQLDASARAVIDALRGAIASEA